MATLQIHTTCTHVNCGFPSSSACFLKPHEALLFTITQSSKYVSIGFLSHDVSTYITYKVHAKQENLGMLKGSNSQQRGSVDEKCDCSPHHRKLHIYLFSFFLICSFQFKGLYGYTHTRRGKRAHKWHQSRWEAQHSRGACGWINNVCVCV